MFSHVFVGVTDFERAFAFFVRQASNCRGSRITCSAVPTAAGTAPMASPPGRSVRPVLAAGAQAPSLGLRGVLVEAARLVVLPPSASRDHRSPQAGLASDKAPACYNNGYSLKLPRCCGRPGRNPWSAGELRWAKYTRSATKAPARPATGPTAINGIPPTPSRKHTPMARLLTTRFKNGRRRRQEASHGMGSGIWVMVCTNHPWPAVDSSRTGRASDAIAGLRPASRCQARGR